MSRPSRRRWTGLVYAALFIFGSMLCISAYGAPRFRHLNMEDGLSNNEVFDILQDTRGYIWLATADGLNRYDGYTFKVFRHEANDPTSLSGNFVRSLCEDSQGRLWVATQPDGLNLYNPATESFKHYHHIPGDPDSPISDSIWTLKNGPNGTILLGTFDAGLDIFDPKTGKFTHFPAGSGPESPANNIILSILVDEKNRVWLGSPSGLDLLDPTGKTPTQHYVAPGNTRGSDIVSIAEDSQHRLRLATHAGPYTYTPGDVRLRPDTDLGQPGDAFSKAVLYGVIVDSHKNLWYTGLGAGLYLLRNGSNQVREYVHGVGEIDSLSSDTTFEAFEDKAGLIWVATDSGVNILDPHVIDVYSLKPSDIATRNASITDKMVAVVRYKNKLLLSGSRAIYQFPLNSQDESLKDAQNIFLQLDPIRYGGPRAITVTNAGNLLVSTESGDLLSVSSTGHILQSWHPEVNGNKHGRLANRILPFGQHHVYLATFGNGLLDFDLRTNKAQYVAGTVQTELAKNDIVEDLLQVAPGKLWAGTFRGVFQVDIPTGRSFLVPMTPGSTEPVVQSLYEDKLRNLWIGTYNGLWRIRLDINGNPLSRPQPISQFSHTQVLAIEQDVEGRLWLATVNSLIRFNPENDDTFYFGKNQGSPISEYYSYGHAHTSDGRLWFAGGQGAVGFLPQNLKPNTVTPTVVVNGVTAFRDGKPAVLSVIRSTPLTLTYEDSISIFDVAAMDFGAPQANTYSYRLVGFQSEWTPPTLSHLITFTNLNPGHYQLQVRAANNWGVWSTAPAELDINVLPPWWRTWWAYTLYLLAFIGSAVAYVYSLKRKIEREKEVSASLREANEIKSNFVEKLTTQVLEATQELRETLQGVNLKNAELEIAQRRATEGEQVKSQFLANMSHELRTPLTGVLGYTRLLGSTQLNSEQKDYVGTIRQSSETLLAIINDTLDLSRLEAGKLLIDEVDFDLLELIESTLELLAPIAYQKRLELVRVIPPDVPLQLRGDPLRLRQILTNLLSNAIKFTESGAVCIQVEVTAKEEREAELAISVSDTGIGIPEGEIGQLFNAYARGRISTRHQVEGTGLGLAICKKLVDLMGGQIQVKSRVGSGTTFRSKLKFRLQKNAALGARLPGRMTILLYDRYPLSSQAWRASLTRLGAEVHEVSELEALVTAHAHAAVLSLSERELTQLYELKLKFSPALPPILILAPRIDRQALKDLSETLYHRVLSKSAREKTVLLELHSLVQAAIQPAAGAAAFQAPAPLPASDAPLVLVADDNRINRRLLVTMLNQAGFRTAEAGNGHELLEVAGRATWHAALLDIHMPGMDGIETATRLRAVFGKAVPPIIAMSADVLPENQDQMQKGLMDDFLMKPFNEQQLLDLLQQHLRRHARNRQNAS